MEGGVVKGRESLQREIRKTEEQQLAVITHTYISGLWMQDKTGVTHLGFVSACVCLCENVQYVHLRLYSLCFVCENQKRGNNDVTEKHEKNCRNNN